MEAPPITDHQLEEVLQWLQTMVFSRTPKNLVRDFSDGVLMAEIMRHHYPQLIQLHNYQPASSSASKYINWKMLSQKVFRKIGLAVSRSDIQGIVGSVPGVIQRVLVLIYNKIVSNQQANLSQTSNLANKLSQLGNTSMSIKKASIMQQERNNTFAKELSSQLADKQMVIKQLRQTIQILQTKMKKMQQLSKLKDAKIDSLMRKLDEGIGL